MTMLFYFTVCMFVNGSSRVMIIQYEVDRAFQRMILGSCWMIIVLC